jgi:hypothetical protein
MRYSYLFDISLKQNTNRHDVIPSEKSKLDFKHKNNL